jgi:alpha-galactosidase
MRLFSKVFFAAFLLSSPVTVIAQTISGTASTTGFVRGGAPYVINPTPPMGWNSWIAAEGDTYPNPGWQPNETTMKAEADALVSTGLAALGYNLISIDGGWGDRDTNGNIRGVPAQFPSGMKSLGDYLHSKGLLLGLYGTPTLPQNACLPDYAAQYGHEVADATLMGSWGLDYFKYDICSGVPSQNDAGSKAAYVAMGNALHGTGRQIGFLINAYSGLVEQDGYYPQTWAAPSGASLERIGGDNNDPGSNLAWWWHKAFYYDWTVFSAYQHKGLWMDPDNLMMQQYEGGPGSSTTTSQNYVGDAEGRTQFNWYAVIAAPLVIATRIYDLTPTSLQTLSNTEVIAVDQDSLGIMGYRVSSANCGASFCQVWVRQLANGYAVLLMNGDPSAAHDVSVTWSQFGQSGNYNIRDLWAHASAGSSSTGYTASAIPAWGSVMLLIRH